MGIITYAVAQTNPAFVHSHIHTVTRTRIFTEYIICTRRRVGIALHKRKRIDYV